MAQRIINLVVQEDEKKKQASSLSSQSKNSSQQSSKNGGSAKAQPSRGSQNENEGESGLDEENGSSGGDIDDGATESSGASQGQDDNTSSSSSATAKGAGGSSVIDINKMLQEEDDYGDIGVLMMNETSDDACDSYKIPQLPKYEKKKINNPKLDEVKAISASSRMRAKMYGMLQATKRQPVHFGTTGKKIKAKRLVGMSVGDPRIFSKKIETKAMNTAVVICVDYSGSMSGATKVSNPAAFAVHHALFGLPGTAVATMSFGTITCEGKDSFLVLVGFGEKPISSQFNLPAQGGTPTTEVIWGARALLLERPEKRKIIMVVTDGSPNSTTTAKEAIKRTEQDGIQVCAIGIDTQCVKHLFKKSACIKNINELPDKMFIILDELMFD
jgi:cobalamin biosynthesis protein CobT